MVVQNFERLVIQVEMVIYVPYYLAVGALRVSEDE
jgi:hypothetical protein